MTVTLWMILHTMTANTSATAFGVGSRMLVWLADGKEEDTDE